MGRLTVTAVLAVALAGCAAWDRLVEVVSGDPLGAALVTVEEQVTAVRGIFIARDVAEIETCRQHGGGDECDARRCQQTPCTLWRLRLDPLLTEAYNLTRAAWEADRSGLGTRTAVLALLGEAATAFEQLAAVETIDELALGFRAAAATVRQVRLELDPTTMQGGGAVAPLSKRQEVTHG